MRLARWVQRLRGALGAPFAAGPLAMARRGSDVPQRHDA